MGGASDKSGGWDEYLDVDRWLAGLRVGFAAGEQRAVEDALAFLELDAYFLRSGYAREKVARWLAQTSLTPEQRGRVRGVVLSTVDGQHHCPHPGVGRLARAAADNDLRRALRSRLHGGDPDVAWRALRIVVCMRRPGLTGDDLAAAQALVLRNAAAGAWLSPVVERVAMRLWSGAWEQELRGLLPYHGPDRAAAKRLLGAVERRRSRRPGP